MAQLGAVGAAAAGVLVVVESHSGVEVEVEEAAEVVVLDALVVRHRLCVFALCVVYLHYLLPRVKRADCGSPVPCWRARALHALRFAFASVAFKRVYSFAL